MTEMFIANPWLLVCAMVAVVIVACVAIVFITDFLRQSHKTNVDAGLKQHMLALGLSAQDIKTILEASSDGEAARLALGGNQGVRVGLGAFQVEVGNVNKGAKDAAASAAHHG